MRTCLAAVCGSLLLAGCGAAQAGDGAGGGSALEVTREDGSRIELPDALHAWCGRVDDFRSSPKDTPARALHVLGGELPVDRGDEEPPSYWLYSQRVQELEQARTVSLADAPDRGAVMFVLDGETGNELATDVEDTMGMVVVEEWGCEPGDAVRIKFDGTLGSEYGDSPSATIGGEVEAEIGEPPPLPR